MNWIRKGLGWIVFLVFTLLFLEGGLRVFHYFYRTPIFYDGSYNRFRGRPNSENYGFKLNSKGFKDKEFGAKQDSVYRILGIGDSFAFGIVPYQYNYLTLIEYKLKGQNIKAEVFNMGIPSTGPLSYWSLLEREGISHKPDMVLLSFFVGNDFVEDLKTRKNQFVSYTYLGSLFYYLNKMKNLKQTDYNFETTYCDTCKTTDRNTFVKIEQDRSRIFWENDKVLEDGFPPAFFYLLKIKEVCDKNNIELVIAILPDCVQIDSKIRDEVIRKETTRTKSDWIDNQPNSWLTQGFREQGIKYIDLYDTFKSASESNILYKPNDTHWNIKGNQLAAETIAAYLQPIIKSLPQ